MKKLAALLIALNVVAMTAATYSSPRPADPYAADIALTKEYSRFQDSTTGKFGYKHNGRIVIPAKYYWTGSFSEGLASVYTGKYGFIDKSGTLVIPAKYDNAWNFSEGLARVKTDGRCGFIDKSGALIIPAEYDWAGKFSDGLAKVKTDGKYGFIDKSGALVIPAEYDWAEYFCEGLAFPQRQSQGGT